MIFMLQPWQLPFAILSGWIRYRQQQIIEFQNDQIQSQIKQWDKRIISDTTVGNVLNIEPTSDRQRQTTWDTFLRTSYVVFVARSLQFKANERLSSIKWAMVDFELAKLFPSPFEQIELDCFPGSGGNSRGSINGIEKGFSARGAQRPNYAFGSLKVAMQELFKSVTTKKIAQTRYKLERRTNKE